MAYGQTGTGKTYTVGKLGKDDASERGIMVRALEDILASTTRGSDIVEVSYLQVFNVYLALGFTGVLYVDVKLLTHV
jgi:kinesin family protein 5